MSSKINTEIFIKKARIVHGDKYRYNETVYDNAKTKVKIFCNKCKQYFYQTPNNHLNNHGCPVCGLKIAALKNTKKIDNFIFKAIKIHGTKYDYSNIKYVNASTKIEIHCNICNNNFLQTPNDHICGHGCPYCARKFTQKRNTKTQKVFIEQAKKIHNNIYDYSKVVYKNSNTKIEIKCKTCNKTFFQKPHNHIIGQGCPYCSGRIKTKNDFIKNAQKIHGNKYNYDNVVYNNSTTKVEIYCNACNKCFSQTPNSHLCGRGCPYCKKSKGEEKIKQILESNNIQYVFQKKFTDCRDKLSLPFDFYLPDHNLCIEYQGKQHYDPKMFILLFKNHDKGVFYYKYLNHHDKIKRQYCKKNKIKLLELKCFDNIEEKILKTIQNKE